MIKFRHRSLINRLQTSFLCVNLLFYRQRSSTVSWPQEILEFDGKQADASAGCDDIRGRSARMTAAESRNAKFCVGCCCIVGAVSRKSLLSRTDGTGCGSTDDGKCIDVGDVAPPVGRTGSSSDCWRYLASRNPSLKCKM